MQLDLCKVNLASECSSSGTDITLDDVLTIFDEDYNNVKALDSTESRSYSSYRMVDKETVLD